MLKARDTKVQDRVTFQFKEHCVMLFFFSIRIGRFRNQGVGAGVAMLTILPNDLLVHLVFLRPATLISEDL